MGGNAVGRGELVVFADRVSPDGQLEGVFVQDRLQGTPGVVTAARARQERDPATGARYVVLVNGHRYEGLDDGRPVEVGSFAEYAFRIPEVPLDLTRLTMSAIGWQALLNSDNPVYQAALQ